MIELETAKKDEIDQIIALAYWVEALVFLQMDNCAVLKDKPDTFQADLLQNRMEFV
jgi:hypothetical protein